MANCVLAAAITVYCGPLQTLTRHKFFDSLRRTCRQDGFPTTDQDMDKVLKLDDFPQFMLGVVRTYFKGTAFCMVKPIRISKRIIFCFN